MSPADRDTFRVFCVSFAEREGEHARPTHTGGVELWLQRFGTAEDKEDYGQRLKREQQFLELTSVTRGELKTVYDSEMSAEEKRHRKEQQDEKRSGRGKPGAEKESYKVPCSCF